MRGNSKIFQDDDDDEEMEEGQHKHVIEISKEKMQMFQTGFQTKKTPHQRAKEAELAKKKLEEEIAAKVLADFEASLEAPNKPKGWIKGATIVPSVLFDKDEGVTGKPSPNKPSAGSLYRPQSKFNDVDEPKKVRDAAAASATMSVLGPSKASKKRQLDAYLEELKQTHEGKESRTRQKTDASGQFNGNSTQEAFGSYDTGDGTTTNLYVGNLSPTLDEQALCKEFAVYGPIGSVKIMWPRTQEERDRNRNCGFISFMNRADAEKAVKAMDGKEVLGYVMRVGWGKPVPVPPQPIYVLDSQLKSGLPFNAQAPQVATQLARGFGKLAGRPEVRVVIPEDPDLAMLIHRTLERVLVYGPAFEALLMQKEEDNPKYSFLFQNYSPEHVYYRWKMYSLLQGDGKYQWPLEPFAMFDEGPIWIPPDIPFDDLDSADGSASSTDSDDPGSMRRSRTNPNHPKGSLQRHHRHRLETKIRQLTLSRVQIGDLMVFCIDHADAAEEIVEIITRSLTLPSTPIFPTKMARLYLLSDVLHNSASSVPNAWKFRTALERQLPTIFSHLGTVWKSISARLRAEQMRRAVFAVVSVWERSIVFTKDFTDKLRELFTEAGRAADELAKKNIQADLEKEQRFLQVLQEHKDSKTGVFSLDDADMHGASKETRESSSLPPHRGFVKATGTNSSFKPATSSGFVSIESPSSSGFVPIATISTPSSGTAPKPSQPKRKLPIHSSAFESAEDDE